MRILHIPTGGLFSDGIFSCIAAYVAVMNRTNIELTILATNQPAKEIVKRVESLDCSIAVIPYRKEKIGKYIEELYRYLKNSKFDIVHVHGSSAIMAIELMIAKLAGCKVRIAHSHNTTCENKRVDSILRPMFYYSYTHAFACGQDAGKWLFKEREFTVIPNGRDLKKYEFNEQKRNCWRRKLSLQQDDFVIGHVGRFNYQKNHEYIVRIFQEVIKRKKKAHLVLIGTGENFEKIKKKIYNAGLDEQVQLLGSINNVEEVLSAIDIMILPSRYEGLPLVVIEWQASGLPCIISETITGECMITGLVRKLSIQASPEIWADTIVNTVITDRNSTKEQIKLDMQEAGYDIETGAKELKALYQEFVDEVKR